MSCCLMFFWEGRAGLASSRPLWVSLNRAGEDCIHPSQILPDTPSSSTFVFCPRTVLTQLTQLARSTREASAKPPCSRRLLGNSGLPIGWGLAPRIYRDQVPRKAPLATEAWPDLEMEIVEVKPLTSNRRDEGSVSTWTKTLTLAKWLSFRHGLLLALLRLVVVQTYIFVPRCVA